MKLNTLGNTGLKVSEFCMGLLPLGPLQLDVAREAAAEMIKHAFDHGVNFFDTAQAYRTQPYIKAALGSDVNNAVIATKSAAVDEDAMAAAVEQALEETGSRRIGIFHLHAARDPEPFDNRAGAHKRLLKYKEEGVIRAVGVATHFVSVTREAARRDDVDVIIAINNLTGMGILDGTAEDMSAAMQEAAAAGKGVYDMKPLAGGNLIDRMMEAVDYARNIPGSSAVALGPVSLDEVKFDLRVFEDEPLAAGDYERTAKTPKKYIILGGCRGCGTCVEECPNNAIEIVDGKARIDEEECLRCGYCAGACPDFWIRAV
ncbi:MAG: aldo/keto reductase [Planctomycetes bacterium]|nr:aldo/keto reductase [Planctomycetota bacterium]